MFPTGAIYFGDFFSLGPLILCALTLAVMTYAYFKLSRRRTAQNILMIAIIAGLLSSILLVSYVFSSDLPSLHAAHSFYGIYTACTYLSVYVSLHKMIKQKESITKNKDLTTALIYIGYFFSAVAIAFGIATTIVQSLLFGNLIDEMQTAYFAVINILLHVIWPLLLIDIALFCLVNKDLTKEACNSLLAFNIFTTVVVVVQTIMTWAPILYSPSIGFLSIFCIDLPSVAAILIWFFAQQKDLSQNELSFKESQGLANNPSSA